MYGLSVANQVNLNKYFSLSTITPERIKFYGINMTVEQLRAEARKRPYAFTIYTGSAHLNYCQQRTKIWRYEDFVEGST